MVEEHLNFPFAVNGLGCQHFKDKGGTDGENGNGRKDAGMKLVGRHGRMKVPTLMGRKHGLGQIIFAGEGKDPLLKVQMQDGTIVTCLRSEFSIMRAGPLRSDDVVTRVPLEKHMRVGALNGRI